MDGPCECPCHERDERCLNCVGRCLERIDPIDVREELEKGLLDGELIGYELVFRSTTTEGRRSTVSDGTSQEFRNAVMELVHRG